MIEDLARCRYIGLHVLLGLSDAARQLTRWVIR